MPCTNVFHPLYMCVGACLGALVVSLQLCFKSSLHVCMGPQDQLVMRPPRLFSGHVYSSEHIGSLIDPRTMLEHFWAPYWHFIFRLSLWVFFGLILIARSTVLASGNCDVIQLLLIIFTKHAGGGFCCCCCCFSLSDLWVR